MTIRILTLFLGMLTLGAVLLAGTAARTDEPRPPPLPDGVEVQARGPVHEAYAEPAGVAPQPGPLVAKGPPEAIEEMPPEQKPEGDTVQWIPGYWAWDQDRDDFLWVSGFWRAPPPGRQWVAGHWQQAEGGWQWVHGLWAQAGQNQLEYVPPPPALIDSGASVPAPDETSTYAPGCWVYRQTRYLWRPGFWVAHRPDWLWVPDRYAWTPGGCLFVEGYWDHPLDDRGLLFAPVTIDRRHLAEAGWSYTPQYVVRTDFLLGALFVRPSTCQYYFGDYFEDRYERRGFVPWVDYRVGRDGYDPMYSYYRQAYHDEPRWDRDLRGLYTGRREGDILRPPHTLIQQQTLINNITANKTENVTVNKVINFTNVQNASALMRVTQVNNSRITNLSSLARGHNTQADDARRGRVVKLETMPREQRDRVLKESAQLRDVSQERRRIETQMQAGGPAPVKPTDRARTAPLELPKLPLPPARPHPGAKGPPPPQPAAARPEERPIPRHEPAPPPGPPRREAPPSAPRKEMPPPPPPGRVAPPPEPRKVAPPAPPPMQTPPPPRREAPPAPRKEMPPPPPPGRVAPPPEPRKVAPPAPPPMQTPPPPRRDTPAPRPEPPRKQAPAPPPPPKKDAAPPPPPPRREAPHPAPPRRGPPAKGTEGTQQDGREGA